MEAEKADTGSERSDHLKAGDCVRYELPGWSYADFTRTNKLGLWNISRMLEVGRVLFKSSPLADAVNKLTPRSGEVELIAVVSAQKTLLTRDIYRLSALQCPMFYCIKLGYIGETSYSFVFELWHQATGALLARQERQLVFIEAKSRKAHPIPEALKRIRDNYPRYPFSVHVEQRPSNRDKVFVTTFKIVASDMDNLYHTNQSSYYRFSMDAAYEAWKSRFLTNFTEDICKYEVKTFEGKHYKETFAGDHIAVALWEDESDRYTLHFEISKGSNRDNTLVMYQRITFFPLVKSRM